MDFIIVKSKKIFLAYFCKNELYFIETRIF